MSEYRVDALHVDHAALARIAGSRDARVLRAISEHGLPELVGAALPSGFPRDAVQNAALAIVRGDELDPRRPEYAFGRWVVATYLAVGAPDPPSIGYPFADLYAVTEALRQTPYEQVARFVEALNGERPDDFPLGPPALFDLPGVGYLAPESRRALVSEARAARIDLGAGDEDVGASPRDWADEIEEPEDLAQVLRWIETPPPAGAGLAMFMSGDL